VDYAHAMIAKAASGQRSVNFSFVADEVKSGDVFVSLKCPFGAFDDDATTMIATHDIHCNSHIDG
jgi:GTP cyclohydrolase II